MGIRVPNYHPSEPDYGKDLVYAHDGVREATRLDRFVIRSMTVAILAPPILFFALVAADIVIRVWESIS